MAQILKTWLPVLAVCVMVLNAFDVSAADLTATVERDADGKASIKFAGSDSGEKITAYDQNGMPLAKLNWAASFIFPISEKALRDSKKKGGIDIKALLKGMGVVQADGDMLVKAELPIGIQDLDGRDLPKGTNIYLKLDRLAREGVVVPTNAWGPNMGAGKPANEFNTTLGEKGVIGAKSQKKFPVQAPKPGRARGVHGDGIVPMDDVSNSNREGSKFLSAPVCYINSNKSTRFSSRWGGRTARVTKNKQRMTSFHDGLDLAVPRGTPVMAAAAGCIDYKDIGSNRYAGYGFNIKVDHGNGFMARYAHLNNFSEGIREFIRTGRGQKYCFERGEYIGNSGETGNCTGPHLHFGLSKNGRSVDPLKYMLSQSVTSVSQSCDDLQASNDRLAIGGSSSSQVAESDSDAAPRSASAASAASGVAR